MSNRIVTLTLNPAVDLASSAKAVVPTHKIRTTDEHIDPGGGGINVSRVIQALGGETLAPTRNTASCRRGRKSPPKN